MSPTRTCRVKEGSVDGGTCSAQATCGYALDLGPGIDARIVEHYRSECKPTEDAFFTDGGFYCSCRGGAFDLDYYLVTAPSVDEVCKPMLGFCTAEEAPVYSDPVCGAAEPSGTVDQICPMGRDCRGCIMSLVCGWAAPIDPDVSIITQDYPYRYVICRPQQGELQCSCETSTEGLYGDESVPSATLEVCRASSEVCQP